MSETKRTAAVLCDRAVENTPAYGIKFKFKPPKIEASGKLNKAPQTINSGKLFKGG